MTFEELLKEQGVGDEVVEKIVSAMKENKIFTVGEENLDVRYGKLKTDHESLQKQLSEANGLIDQFKKSAKGNDELQGKIGDYQAKIGELEQELASTRLNSALKLALSAEKAVDIDYLMFKLESSLKDDNKTLELDESGNIKGWGDMLAGLKTKFPAQFEGSNAKRVEEHKLEQGSDTNALTKAEILKKPYAERMKLYSENKEAYESAMHQG